MPTDTVVALSDSQLKFIDQFILKIAGTGAETPPVADAEATALADFETRWKTARRRWQDASDTVDGQINRLCSVLKGSDDDELREIGDLGLNAFTGNQRVGIMTAVLEIDSARGHPSSGQISKARSSIDAFRAHLGSDERIRACDSNPFGITVSIAATLSPALGQLLEAIETAPAQ